MNLRTLRRVFGILLLAFAAGCTCSTDTPTKRASPKKKLEVRKEAIRPFLAPKKSGKAVLRGPNAHSRTYHYAIKREPNGTELVRRTEEPGSDWIWRFPDDGRTRTIQLLQVFAEGSLTSFDFEVTTPVGTFSPCLRVTHKQDKDGVRKRHYYYCENVGLAKIEDIDGLKTLAWLLEKAP